MNTVTIWNCAVACVAVWLAAPALAADRAPAAAPVAGLVRGIKVLPEEGAPDCSSLKSIVETVTRDCKTNDQKAIAVYNFMRLTHYHRAYPREPGGIPVLKEINCYGWSLCGGLHAEQSALWRELRNLAADRFSQWSRRRSCRAHAGDGRKAGVRRVWIVCDRGAQL